MNLRAFPRFRVRSQGYDLPPSVTVNRMIIHHSGGLHVGINYRGSYEREAPLFQSFADRFGLRTLRRVILQFPEVIHDSFVINETPDVGIEASVLLLNFQEPPGVIYRSKNF